MPIFRRREMSHALRRSKARVLVVAERFRGRDHLAETADAGWRATRRASPSSTCSWPAPASTSTLLPRDAACSGTTSPPATEQARADPEAIAARAPAPDAIAQLLFTSGTTGEPRASCTASTRSPARRRWRSSTSASGATTSCSSPPARPPDRVPLRDVAEAFVLGCDADPAGRVGAGARRAGAARVGRLLRAGRDAVPHRPRPRRGGGRAARRARCASSSSPAPRCRARWPSARRRSSTRRSAAPGARPSPASARSPRPATTPRSVWGTDGRALAGTRIRIIDDAGHRRSRAGEEGNFEVFSRCLFEGYLERPDLTAAALTADGWYRTGDLATIDADGFLRITGRIKDVVNRGGEKVPVAEIEQLLHATRCVEDVAIVAMPDQRLGERACAFVVAGAEGVPDLAAVREYLDELEVARQYWPERIETIEVLPRNASGKIQKFLLRELAAGLNVVHREGACPMTQHRRRLRTAVDEEAFVCAEGRDRRVRRQRGRGVDAAHRGGARGAAGAARRAAEPAATSRSPRRRSTAGAGSRSRAGSSCWSSSPCRTRRCG